MATPTTLPASFVSGAVLTAAQMNNLRGAFRVLQVVSATKTDTFTQSTNTFTDITDLSVSITPSSTSSKVLILFTVQASTSGSTSGALRLMRDSTAIFVGATAGSRTPASTLIGSSSLGPTSAGIHLDSPATTSAITYKVQARANDNAASVFINRGNTDSDTATFTRQASSITVMEISA